MSVFEIYQDTLSVAHIELSQRTFKVQLCPLVGWWTTDYWGEQEDLLVFIQSPAALKLQPEKSFSLHVCLCLLPFEMYSFSLCMYLSKTKPAFSNQSPLWRECDCMCLNVPISFCKTWLINSIFVTSAGFSGHVQWLWERKRQGEEERQAIISLCERQSG